MKIALITDQHYGTRSSNMALDRSFERFYSQTFFPYIDENPVEAIIDLGDTFDQRKSINFLTFNRCIKYWFDEVLKRDLPLHIITGNHSTYYKNTNSINSPDLLLGKYPNISVYSQPETVHFDGIPIGMLPWITSENMDECLDFVKHTPANILMAHLELSGFLMNSGIVCNSGMGRDVFSRFVRVFTGHFHKKTDGGNISYLGSPYQMTWADYGDERGFHIFDTETNQIEFIPNPHNIFVEVEYHETDDKLKPIDSVDLISNIDFSGKYVKVRVFERNNPVEFDRFLNHIYDQEPENVKISENFSSLSHQTETDIEHNISTDTKQLICNAIQDCTLKGVDKDRLVEMAINIYEQAITKTRENDEI